MNYIRCALLGIMISCGLSLVKAEEIQSSSAPVFDIKAADKALASKKYGEARDLYLEGAEAGNGRAQAMLCYVYAENFGVYPARADVLAEATVEAAQKAVAEKYAEALKWCRSSEAQGDPRGETMLGQLYERGVGVPQDYGKARELYLKAAKQDHATAQDYLAGLSARGHGVKQDYTEALRWYRLAASQGHAAAMLDIGTFYEHGNGVQKDISEAFRWYLMAADKGDALAESYVADMYRAGTGVKKDEAEADKWYRRAADHGNAYAKKYLDWKAARDMNRGIDSLSKAVDFGKP